MLTGKQRRYLRALATEITPIFQVGKGGMNDSLIEGVSDALDARELIKIRVLNNSLLNTKDVAQEISEKTNADLVQVIGHNLILFRRSTKKPQIELP
ncbi:MAG: ribosome assembly RNA-binding protein YhbY [Bacillota bacterium]|nr:ribosome assembly RNA-binding protein YhbY [Bacillota bacterium]